MIVKVVADRTFHTGLKKGLTLRVSWTEDARRAPKVGDEEFDKREILTRARFSQKIIEVEKHNG